MLNKQLKQHTTEDLASLIELLERRADTCGEQALYTFLGNRSGDEQSLSYVQLQQRAKALGAQLQRESVAGQPAILLCPPGLDYIVGYWGALYGGAIAVPAYPPERMRLAKTLPRIEAIIADCQPSVILATGDIIAMADTLAEMSAVFHNVRWLAVDQLETSVAEQWQAPVITPDSLAFLQYTSGSTSSPKGVMVSHGNLLHNSSVIAEFYTGNKLVSWLPPYHDMGLIGTIIQVVHGAGSGHFMAPLTFLRQPFRWLEAISRTRADYSVAPNFGYDHCVNKITDEQLTQLDLSRWRHAFCGAEPIRKATVDAFCERFSGAGFKRSAFQGCYGLAEATLKVTGTPMSQGPSLKIVDQRALEQRRVAAGAADKPHGIEAFGVGKAVRDTRVEIVNPETFKPCQKDQVGEIWVSSPSVAKGYWNRPEATAASFNVRMGGGDNTGFLRTGDLGFMDEQGELYISGRLKDVIIMRGRNLHPTDLERAALHAYPTLRNSRATAFGAQVAGREEVVLLLEVPRAAQKQAPEILVAIRKNLASAALDVTPHAVLLVAPGSIPQTSSGKLQRHAAREEFLHLQCKVVAASVLSDEAAGKAAITTQKAVANTLISELKALDCPALSGDIDTQLRLAGCRIHYDDLITIKLAMEAQLGISVPLGRVLEKPDLANLIGVCGSSVEVFSAQLCVSAPEVAVDAVSETPQEDEVLEDIEQCLINTLAAKLGLPQKAVDLNATFDDLGLDSVGSVELAEELADRLRCTVPETLVWEHPTLRDAAQFLASVSGTATAPTAKTRHTETATETEDDDETIAIVGLGCRFPNAASPEEFWQLLCDERDAISEVPAERWSTKEFATTKDGRPVSAWGGFLEDIAGFEPQFFGLSVREAERMDPQQRLLLEVAWQTVEHAGINPNQLRGQDVGVFMAVSNQDYWTLQAHDPAELDIHACTGNASSVAANRISYTLDLRGPSFTVDTACSGSLVSVHLACESLRRGECSQALAGGVNLMIKPDLTVAFSEAHMLSPQGRCRTFDDSADGYVRGEGCGVVMLERLADAKRKNSPIIALIPGSAVQHDGRSNGLTAPNGGAQEAVIGRALQVAKVQAADVAYVEAHGTGTPLGDPTEARVLARTYGAAHREDQEACVIGSVKTNIGHLESAAGIAGLIKAALSVQHGIIPAQLHCEVLNRHMDWQDSGLEVARQAQPWPKLQESASTCRRAAVSSFGFGGTLAHMIVSEAPALPSDEAGTDGEDQHWHILPLSARSNASLTKQLPGFAQYLGQTSHCASDVCFTAATGRASFSRRCAVVARGKAGLKRGLQLAGDRVEGITPASHEQLGEIALCFSGQGSQYAAMARDLIARESVVCDTIERCHQAAHSELGHSLFDLLTQDKHADLLRDTRFQQPVLYTLHCALAALWRSWGVAPNLVMGHSIGEFAAAHAAGVFTLEEGLRLVLARAQAMAQQREEGAMIACIGDIQNVHELLPEYADRLWIGAYNSPQNIVLSGYRDAVGEFAKRSITDVTVKQLPVCNAFHSPLIAGAVAPFKAVAEGIHYQAPRLPLITNLGGRLISNAPDAEHFCRHLREPVDFHAGVRAAMEFGCRTFIEAGGGSTLIGLARSCVGHSFSDTSSDATAEQYLWLPSLSVGRDNHEVLMRSLAKFWERGGELDWHKVLGQGGKRRVAAPVYPFSRTPHWYQGPTQSTPAKATPSSPTPEETNVMENNYQATLELFRSQAAVLQRLSGSSAGEQLLNTVAPASPIEHEPPAMDTPASQVPSQAESKVMAHLTHISRTPASDISAHMRLNADLGLDSLMRVDLIRTMAREWPSLGQRDPSDLGDDPSVQEVISWVERGLGISAPQPVVSIFSTALEAPPQEQVQPQNSVEDFEEYRANEARVAAIMATGANPYGRIHEGFNGSKTTLEGQTMVNFAAFNYLSLSNHPRVCQAAKKAIDTYGTSPSATPLLYGETPLHHQLEKEIAEYLGTEAAVAFASGHSTSVAVIGHIMDKPDLVIHDQWIHDCAIRGAILSGADRRSFAHNNWQVLDQTLTQIRSQYRRVLIIIEGVYSQDGDLGNLPEFIRIKKKHECMLMIDEAHSIGTMGSTGAGVGEHFAVQRSDVDIWMGTLSKGLGSCGGYIAASQNFIRFLKYTTPLLIFSTGITPANAAAALEAIRVLRDEPQRVLCLQEKSRQFIAMAKARGLDTGVSHDSPVIPVIVGSWERAMVLSEKLKQRGINVMPIGYPAVDKDKCRLRFFINVDHTEEEFTYALDALVEAMAEEGELTQDAICEGERA